MRHYRSEMYFFRQNVIKSLRISRRRERPSCSSATISAVWLYIASIAGVFSFIVAIAAMLFIIIRRLVFGDPVAGWASTVVIILFIGGIQLLSIGILGLYLSKLYLEAKDRPIYLIGESNIEKPTEKN